MGLDIIRGGILDFITLVGSLRTQETAGTWNLCSSLVWRPRRDRELLRPIAALKCGDAQCAFLGILHEQTCRR